MPTDAPGAGPEATAAGEPGHPAASPRLAYVVWGTAVLAYAIAVLQRTSLGVSGLEAAHQFSTTASVVAVFVVVQLLVYALAQVPAGLLLDRFGARATLASGAILMAAGQITLAFTDGIALAIGARVVVALGDALTFSSAVRIIPAWFPHRRVPLLTQLTGILGQLGQILSAVPFVGILVRFGWTAAYASAASMSVLAAVLVLLIVRPVPPGTVREIPEVTLRGIPADVAAVVRHPATQLGFWTHWTSGFPGMVFSMMWGFPYLTAGEGLPVPVASALMSAFVVAGIATGPLIGAFTHRHPLRRSSMVLIIVGTSVVPLLLLLVWPGPAPLWLLLIYIVGLAVGGPGSNVGFDFPRTNLPGSRLGTATGIVIMGGFLAALACILLIGAVLDLLRPSGQYDLASFRLAFAVERPFLLAGVVGMIVARRKLRRRMAERGLTVPRWREVWAQGRLHRL